MRNLIHLLPLGLVLLFSACQTAGQGGTPVSTKPLPTKIRAVLARQLSFDYLDSALGPASISAPKQVTGWSGPSTYLSVRYLVKDRGRLAEAGATVSRCIDVWISDNQDGGFSISTSRSRDDGRNCSSAPTMSSFPELTQLRERLQACKARGEMPCLLSTNMPIAQARKLMKQKN